jgi:hypothetical protein
MHRLILHAGGPKTASSYLQVLLAQEAERLAAAGVLVPEGRESAAAREGRITSGNGLELANFLDTSLKHVGAAREAVPDAVAAALEGAGGRTVVYSSEFIDCAPGPRMDRLRAVAAERGYAVEFVFYVRNVASSAYSFYSQSVKRHNDARDFEAFLETWRPPYLPRVERAAACLPPEAVRVFNYDRLSGDIARHFFAAVLGVEPPEAAPATVNRSLTYGELSVLRRMNAHFPKNNAFSTFVSDAIVYNAPAPQDYEFRLTPAEARRLEALFAGEAARLNAWLGDAPIAVVGPETAIGARRERELSEVESVMLAVMTSLVKGHVNRAIEERRAAARAKVAGGDAAR